VRRPDTPVCGDVALAELIKVGKNTKLELKTGRTCTLHQGDLLAVAFGNRYATLQFEGYASADGDRCDLLSMGGICGLVRSKHAGVAEPTKLRIIGGLADESGKLLSLNNYTVTPTARFDNLRVVIVCGTSMDAGKTYTASNLIFALRRHGFRVAGIKLTGTAAGKDTWGMLDAGACVALDFIDGGFPSTYLCSTAELFGLYSKLRSEAAANGAEWAVIEIADGLLQRETAALLQSPDFHSSVYNWLFAAGDPMSAEAGVRLLRSWGIEPIAVSGLTSMSALSIKETEAATQLPCLTAEELECGHGIARFFQDSARVQAPLPHRAVNPLRAVDGDRFISGSRQIAGAAC
jgi:hypothetical protein